MTFIWTRSFIHNFVSIFAEQNIFWDKREKLCKSLNIEENESNVDNPILYEYLKDQSKRKPQQQSAGAESADLPQNVLDLIQHKFDKFDTGKKRFLDKDKTKRLFMNMFPTFSKYCFLYMLLCACFFL